MDPTSPTRWSPVVGEVAHLSLRLSILCDHCDRPIPVNAPVKRVQCDACLESTPLRGFGSVLSRAQNPRGSRFEVRNSGSRYEVQTSTRPRPSCPQCGEHVDFGPLLTQRGPLHHVPCGSCGTACPTYPVPDWVRGQFNRAIQVFGGEEPSSEPDGTALEVEQTAEPVAMTCPSCDGGLTIDATTRRTTTCPYCSSSIYIPDGLWKILHPVKKKQFWTISYTKKSNKKKKSSKKKTASSSRPNDPSAKDRPDEEPKTHPANAIRDRCLDVLVKVLDIALFLGLVFIAGAGVAAGIPAYGAPGALGLMLCGASYLCVGIAFMNVLRRLVGRLRRSKSR